MRNTIASLLVYLLVLSCTTALADRIDCIGNKPKYGRKILVYTYDNIRMQHYKKGTL